VYIYIYIGKRLGLSPHIGPDPPNTYNGVGGEVYGADVVTVDQSDPRQGAVQLHKQLLKPTRLYHTVGHDAVLRLALEREMMF
jgi:hypothetical protein